MSHDVLQPAAMLLELIIRLHDEMVVWQDAAEYLVDGVCTVKLFGASKHDIFKCQISESASFQDRLLENV